MKKLVALAIVLFFFNPLFAWIDLEEQQQPFVLKTKKITIAGYPDAFNPSIIRFDNRLLMSFRARDPNTNAPTLIGLVWLDQQFNPIGPSQILNSQMKHADCIQDPRLVSVDNRLYMPYSALCKSGDKLERRMCIVELFYDGVGFDLNESEALLHFEGNSYYKFEKNWVPFNYNDYLLLSYTIFPHKVLLPLLGEQKCLTVDYSNTKNSWKWGEIRGGTPALLVDNQYLAFFHSSIVMSTAHSNGKPMPHYFMGAYTFENRPPFYVKKISPNPIVGPNFYNGPPHKTWKPLRVVFPAGYIFNEKFIWVAYGRQDHEVWIVQLDKKGLLESLVPNN